MRLPILVLSVIFLCSCKKDVENAKLQSDRSKPDQTETSASNFRQVYLYTAFAGYDHIFTSNIRAGFYHDCTASLETVLYSELGVEKISSYDLKVRVLPEADGYLWMVECAKPMPASDLDKVREISDKVFLEELGKTRKEWNDSKKK